MTDDLLLPRPVWMASSEAPGDWELLLRGGEPFAGMTTLFERHKDWVFRLAYGFLGFADLAEDATQEVFLRMARGRRRWRPRAKFRTWLYRLTLNTCRELARSRRREVSLEGSAALERAVPTGADAGLVTDLLRAVARLPERQREAVVLRHLEGLSTRETARVMGCREGTVKAHLHRALGALREMWETTEMGNH